MSSKRVAVPAGDDPLAIPVALKGGGFTIPVPHEAQNQIQTPITAATTTTSSTMVSASSKSLDALADEFLTLKPPPIMLKPDALPRGETGICRLRTLVTRRAWGDVLKLSSTLLGTSKDINSATSASNKSKSRQYSKVYNSLLIDQNNIDDDCYDIESNIRQETLEIMTLRCNAWLKLRRYSDLSKEVEQWNFLTQNDASAQSPEWIPWALHILAGQSREYNPETGDGAIILCNLRERIPYTEYDWLASLDNALANIFLRREEWRLAILSLDRVFELIPKATQIEVRCAISGSDIDPENTKRIINILTKLHMCELCSRQGRIMLQSGAIFESGVVFKDAKNIWSEAESSVPSLRLPEKLHHYYESLKVTTPSLIELNDGLFHFAKNNYRNALQSFSRAVDIVRKNSSNLHSKYRTEDWIGPSIARSRASLKIYNEAVNNITLCKLYMCDMNEAVIGLEGLVRQDPTKFLTERTAFNLCTLYELGNDSGVSSRNKRVLQTVAKRFFLHDIGPESFRVA